MKPTVGKAYTIDHSRKGKFVAKVLSVSAEWVEVEVAEGQARMASGADVEPGERVTLRRTYTTFSVAP